MKLPIDQRLGGFEEVTSVLSEASAIKEALRCLHCYLGARVNKEKCISCLTCVRICPFGVPTVGSMGEIAIDSFACQACGICAVECPVQAICMGLNTHPEIVREVEDAVAQAEHSGAVIIGFFDLHGNFSSRDVQSLRQDFPNVYPVMIFGLGRVHPRDILKAFECGAGGVILAQCPVDVDPFLGARERIKQRLNSTKAMLHAAGWDAGCLKICDMLDIGLVDKKVIIGLMQKVQSVEQLRSE